MSDFPRVQHLLAAVGALLATALLSAACSSDEEPVVATIANPSAVLVPDQDVRVAVAAGGEVTVRFADIEGVGDSEAPIQHAFVSAADVPPLFTADRGGLIPNPGVWGACRGGTVADAVGTCPLPPIEAPQRWDGRMYWSTGAMVGGEERSLPLATDIEPGTYAFVCALHPSVRVLIGVTGPDGATPPAPATAPAEERHTKSPPRVPATVQAGTTGGDAFHYAFAPATTQVEVGDVVTWIATSRTPVDVVFPEGDEEVSLTHTEPADGLPAGPADAYTGEGAVRSGFLSSDLQTGAAATSFSVRFLAPGTYRYVSRFADDMTGTVVVSP